MGYVPRALRALPLTVVIAAACGPAGPLGMPEPDAGAADSGTPIVANTTVDATTLPCDVVSVMTNSCVSCHSSPPQNGAHVPLLTLTDFTALAPNDSSQTIGLLSLIRMQATDGAMPPPPASPASASDIATMTAWVYAGLLPMSCTAGATAPTTCASNSHWNEGDHGTPVMNPGLSCVACHTSQRVNEIFTVAGTVFADQHAEDLCNGGTQSGGQVRIIGADGKTTTLQVNSAGNFYSFGAIARPYTAQTVVNGVSRTMSSPQTAADCNSCHTEQGSAGAPGRIMWPDGQ